MSVTSLNSSDSDTSVLTRLYAAFAGTGPRSICRLPGAGSGRRYYRMTGCHPVIGVAGTDAAENRAFIALSRHFRAKGLRVPEVYAESRCGMYYIQEDLGDTSLFDFIAPGRERGEWTEAYYEALRDTVAVLPALQWEGARGLDFETICFPVPAMDRTAVMWDLNYFKYCFLNPAGVEFSEPLLEHDFHTLCGLVERSAADTPTFMYRDFQSRNVMLTPKGIPAFIDFQGGRRGPYHYDLVSFLWQARAHFPTTLRERLIDEYIEASKPYIELDSERFRRELRVFVLLRTLQVLGAYGLRGLVERKPHFLNSIPAAIAGLKELIEDMPEGMPELSRILRVLSGMPRWSGTKPDSDRLVVRVGSFGFRKSGIPDDSSANGGGYVFDCRALPNPGRYPEYRSLTGRDVEVVEFLEREGSVADFLRHACALVGPTVERYIQRGFTDLMVSFGCTGGQHRSVYCAERMARFINETYGVEVHLLHREQGIEDILAPADVAGRSRNSDA